MILRTECDRAGRHQVLERQTCTSSSNPPSSLAACPNMATTVEKGAYITCGNGETSPCFTSTSINRHRIHIFHQAPLRDGQPMQPQEDGHPAGRLRTTHLCLLHFTTSSHIEHQESEHVALDGDTLKFDLQPLTSIATGSLQNKIFPPKKEIFKLFLTAFHTWQRKNAVPSISKTNLQELWSTSWPKHTGQISSHITHRDIVKFQTTFPGAVFPNEDKCVTSLRIYCPCLYFQCLTAAFSDPAVFRTIPTSPTETIHPTIEKIKKRFLKSYPLALGAGRDLPNAYVLPKQKRNLLWEGQSSASSHHHIDLCSTALPSSFTNSSRQLSHTSLLKVMYSNSSSNSRRLTLTT